MILEVIKHIKETHDTTTVRFKLDKPAAFLPGQFAFLTLDVIRDGKTKTERKPYSIASAPGVNYLDITAKRHNPGPFATAIHNLKVGDKVPVEFPFGLFTYKKELGNNLIMIAAGSGIVPMKSIIIYNTLNNHDVKMNLIYASRTAKDIIYNDELKELEKKNKNLKLNLTLTQESWHGLSGRIDENMIKNAAPDYMNALFYICGPPVMVNETQKILLSLGIDKSKIKTERYD